MACIWSSSGIVLVTSIAQRQKLTRIFAILTIIGLAGTGVGSTSCFRRSSNNLSCDQAVTSSRGTSSSDCFKINFHQAKHFFPRALSSDGIFSADPSSLIPICEKSTSISSTASRPSMDSNNSSKKFPNDSTSASTIRTIISSANSSISPLITSISYSRSTCSFDFRISATAFRLALWTATASRTAARRSSAPPADFFSLNGMFVVFCLGTMV
mmetsp:Transcript_21958/g.36334  ORF Transcript_21958/g.36334 Transcript_21958/m.36334 type:complete len:213 (+) Transcript_21958:221-859(+)